MTDNILKLFQEAAAKDPEPKAQEVPNTNGIPHKIGAKYNDALTVKEIAVIIRADIKAAIKAGDLPKGLKVSVRSDHNCIDMAVTASPVLISNPARVRWEKANPHDQASFAPCPEVRAMLSAPGQRIMDTLQGFHDDYNFDKGDTQSDYFFVNYYGRATVDYRVAHPEREQIRALADDVKITAKDW